MKGAGAEDKGWCRHAAPIMVLPQPCTVAPAAVPAL